MDQITFIFNIMVPAFTNGLLITLALIAVTAPIGFLLGVGIACDGYMAEKGCHG